MRRVLRALQQLLGSVIPGRDVGTENRFYYDEVEKRWKLKDETEADRAELERWRFHTSRGLTDSLAPPTTACDSNRGLEYRDGGGTVPPPPAVAPPPPGAAPPRPAPSAADDAATARLNAAMKHPVYAPNGLALGIENAGSAAPAAPAPTKQAPTPLASPFAPNARAPMTSPFGGTQAQGAPITSPFGAQPAPVASAPTTSPFGSTPAQGAPITSPFGAQPAGVSAPVHPSQGAPATTPFASPPAPVDSPAQPAHGAPVNSPFSAPPAPVSACGSDPVSTAISESDAMLLNQALSQALGNGQQAPNALPASDV